MLIQKAVKSKSSQSDFIRNLINNYYDSQPTKNEIDNITTLLLKIIDNLSLLKRQMDFLHYSDYSNFITKQISNIKEVINHL